MSVRKILLIIGLSVFLSSTSYSYSFLGNFPNKKPVKIMNDQRDRFFVDFADSVYVYSDKTDYVVRPRDSDSKYRNNGVRNIVSSKGTVYSLVTSSYSPRKSKTTFYHLSLVTCYGPSDYNHKILFRWSNISGSKRHVNYDISSFAISKDDTLFYKIKYISSNGKRSVKKTYRYVGRRRVGKDLYRRFHKNAFASRSGIEVVDKTMFSYRGEKDSSAKEAPYRYKRSVVRDGNDIPHIFFHNTKDRSFYHRFYSRDEGKTIETVVDGPESGQENAAFFSGNKIWSVHYFYRDAFNKGLLVSVSNKDSGEVEKQFAIDASKNRNSGWDLVGGQSSAGRVIISYLSDKNKNKREFLLLDKVSELTDLGENLKKYSNPKGEEYASGDGSNLAKSYLKGTREYQINIGAGVQYVFWNASVGNPNSDSGVSNPYDPEYEFTDSLMNIFSIEGRVGQVNLGADLITKYVDREIEQDDSEANSLTSWNGWIGWDRLFFDFDVKLELSQSQTKVFFEDKSGQEPDRTFNMDFQQLKLSLLTFKRHHFGFLYQNYNFFQPVYIYKVSAGSKSYNFDSKAIGEVEIYNFGLHYGYSKSDYLVKYETSFNDWFVDGNIFGGITLADYNGDITATGNKKPDVEPSYFFGGELEFGWIWYKRFENANQLGFLFKLSYRINGSKAGDTDKPDDKDEEATSDGYYFGYERSEFRHGPMAYLSIVF